MRVTFFYPVTKSQVTHKLKLSELYKPSKVLSTQVKHKQSSQHHTGPQRGVSFATGGDFVTLSS